MRKGKQIKARGRASKIEKLTGCSICLDVIFFVLVGQKMHADFVTKILQSPG